MIQKLLYLAMIAVLLWSCEAKIDEFEASSGTANFETVVFLGNSLTAGYRDGALYQSGQKESYPAIIAQQLALGGLNTKEFKQPYMKNEAGIQYKFVLGPVTDCQNEISLGPVKIYATSAEVQANLANISAEGPFNNLGVPGARLPHLFAVGYADMTYGNPYFGRFAPEASSTIISLAQAQSPTFAVVWIGNNDVLGYALNGGVSDTITNSAVFSGMMNALVASVFTGVTKGAICNIPSITATPFFTTIKPNALVFEEDDSLSIYALNAAYSALGFNFSVGNNFFIIEDVTRPGGMRQINENEMLLLSLPQDSLKCAGWGTMKPIPSEFVLDETEIANIQAAISSFNSTIASIAENTGLALVDMHALMNEAADRGIRIAGQTFSTTFVTGQLFSLDGIHLTGRGYAIAANHIIKAINSKYNSRIPEAIVTDYTGVIFP